MTGGVTYAVGKMELVCLGSTIFGSETDYTGLYNLLILSASLITSADFISNSYFKLYAETLKSSF